MGRYSKRDMVEFAKFAKSYVTPRKVEEAYKLYQKGQRLIYFTPEKYFLTAPKK